MFEKFLIVVADNNSHSGQKHLVGLPEEPIIEVIGYTT